jgi:hypothetical protein
MNQENGLKGLMPLRNPQDFSLFAPAARGVCRRAMQNKMLCLSHEAF